VGLWNSKAKAIGENIVATPIIVSVAGTKLDGNEVIVTIGSTVIVESNPWLLRDSALNSRTLTGNKSIEVEVLSGKRILLHDMNSAYHDVPMNNDDVIFKADNVYSCLTVSVSATAADTAGIDTLGAAYIKSMDYYAKRLLLRNQINEPSISYSKKQSLLQDYLKLKPSGLTVSVPGVTVKGTWEFTESNGLTASVYANGPYADISVSVVCKTLLDF
jgi:hypothetical protein